MDSDIGNPPSLLASVYTSPFTVSLTPPPLPFAAIYLALVCPCVTTEETC